LSMVYPTGSAPDDNPLHVLCCNDTCSFTWTGAEHINQDIFECRTCGLTDSLCCCTECARVCHKGHDCKQKRTAPTAYCDCWEKCKCKTLIAGHNPSRVELLNRIVSECSTLVSMPNSRGESILLFLVQTVGRQMVEQRQYNRNARSRTTSSRKTPSSDVEPDMPDHDLEPPRFSRKALDQLLLDWSAVKSMIMSGVTHSPSSSSNTEDQTYLLSQTGTTLLDKFTHCLIVKCCTEMLDNLLSTLIREMIAEQLTGKSNNATMVARRFIRSVARIFVVFSVEMVPSGGKKRINTTMSQPLAKCKRAFKSLLRVSVEELCETADALIAPVRLGVAKPTAPFHLASNQNDIMQGGEELFSVEPMLPHSSQGTSNRAGPSGSAAAAVVAMLADDLGGEASADGVVSAGEDSMILQSSQRELSPVIVTRRLVARSQDIYEDNEGSEQGDSSERALAGDVEVGGNDEVGGAEPESDGEAELDLLNSESESDDNQSQHEQQSSGNQAARGNGNGQGGSNSVGGGGQ
jgi:E3 ubiquitin-protein ligase EDD1